MAIVAVPDSCESVAAEPCGAASALSALERALACVADLAGPSISDGTLTDVVGLLGALCRCDHALRRLIAGCLLRAEGVAAAEVEGVAGAGWLAVGVTSLSQLAEEQLALSAGEAWQLLRAARAARTSTDLSSRVESRELSLAKAASVERVLVAVRERGEEQRLLDFACANTTHATRCEVARIEEELRTAERTSSVTLHLTRRALSDLRRSRELLADGRGGALPSASSAVSSALAEFVERHCRERRADRGGRRDAAAPEPRKSARGVSERMTPAADSGANHGARAGRKIPADVQHEIVGRHGDVCWVAGCDERTSLQFAHDRPFRGAGSAEASNLALWCLRHHRMIDSGELKLRSVRDGTVLVSRAGIPVARVRTAEPP